MWDVVRFCEQKLLKGRPYQAVVVENVVDAFKWGADDDGGLFHRLAGRAACAGLRARDRVAELDVLSPGAGAGAAVARPHVRGARAARDAAAEPAGRAPGVVPALRAHRLRAADVEEAAGRVWGRYGPQYFYGCPDCRQPVPPRAFPAAAIIDPTIPAPRIGERVRPLAVNTRERIRRGLVCLQTEPFAIRLTHGGAPRPLTLPLVTLTQRDDPAMVFPVAANAFERTSGNRARHADPVLGSGPGHCGPGPAQRRGLSRDRHPDRNLGWQVLMASVHLSAGRRSWRTHRRQRPARGLARPPRPRPKSERDPASVAHVKEATRDGGALSSRPLRDRRPA